MSTNSKPQRYSNKLIVLHWAISILVTVHLVNAFTLHMLRDVQTALILQELHRSFGLIIVLAMLYRIGVRLIENTPEIGQNIPIWQRWSAQLTHFGLYVILLVSPFLGWAYTNSIGMPVSLFWRIPLPDIAPYNPDIGFILLDLHLYFAIALVVLLGLHIAASFYNKYVRQNSVFEKMLILSKDNSFSSFLPIWVRMGMASLIALIACGIIGFSGLHSTNTIGKAYDNVFQSVVLVREAQATWEKFSTKVAWNEFENPKDIKKQISTISSKLQSAQTKISKEQTQKHLATLVAKIQEFAKQSNFNLSKKSFTRVEMNDISLSFNKIIQQLAAIVFETKQTFETLAAQQNDQVVFTLVTTLCFTAIIVIFMTVSTSFQISKAMNIAENISTGNLNKALNIRGYSETANLMRSLEKMRVSLRNQYQWIQDLHSENTNYASSDETGESRIIKIKYNNNEISALSVATDDNFITIKAPPGLGPYQNVEIINEFGTVFDAEVNWVHDGKAQLQITGSKDRRAKSA